MKLEPKQKDWLTKLGAKAATQKKLQDRQDMKAALLTKLLLDRQDEEDDLTTGAKQNVIKEGTKKTQQTLSKNLKETKQFDLDEQRQGYVLGTVVKQLGKKSKIEVEEWDKQTGEQKQFQEVQKAGRIVNSLALQMQMEVDELDENGDPVTYQEDDPKTGLKVTKTKKVPLFDQKEIKEELYTPLVRSGLIPATNVPDDLSDTKEMLDGSFKAYAKRLSKEKKKSLFAENKDLGIAVLKGMISFAGTGLTVNTDSKLPDSQLAWSPSTSEGLHGIDQGFGLSANDPGATEKFADTADKVAQAWVFVQNVSDIAFDLGGEAAEGGVDVLETDTNEKPKHEDEPIKKASGKVAGLAVAEIATAFGDALNDYGLGISASSALGALVKGADLSKKIGKQDIAGAGTLIAEAISKALITLSPHDDVKKAAGNAKVAFTKALNVDQIIKDLKAGKFDKAAAGFATAGAAAADEIHGDNGVRLVFSSKPNVETAQANAGQAVSEEFERDETKKPTPKQIKEHPKDHAPQWLEGEKGFVCMKCPGPGEDPEMFAGMLERKIQKIEADEAIWKWITTVGGMGFDIAADFVAPLAMGGALLRMAKHANEALKRYTDLSNFIDDRQSMINAASAFSAPLAQFIHNSTQQLMHYSINAAMEGLKVIAAVLQLSGLTAPVGVGLTAGANVSQAIETIIYEAKKRWDLETAWKTYKFALENPDNRKAGLVAMQENPTLAKYAVAWGAQIKKDPLVGDFMQSCGLNKDTLKDPEASVDLVVTYLEKRLPDDNVVVGRDYTAAGKVELTVSGFLKEKARGETKLGVKKVETKKLEFVLTQWEIEYPLLKEAKDKDPEAVKKCRQFLHQIDVEMLNYKTFDEEGKAVQEMGDLKARYYKRTKAHTEEMKKW